MLKEFRDFITKGNVLDLAVAVIIGGAFGLIITSLVNDILMPLIGILMGGVDFSTLALTVGDANLAYGNFIQAIINFIVIGFVLFLIIRQANKMTAKKAAEPEAPAAPAADIVLLTEIRDLLKK